MASIQNIIFMGVGAKFYRADSRIQIKSYSRPGIFYWGGEIAPPPRLPSPVDATGKITPEFEECVRSFGLV